MVAWARCGAALADGWTDSRAGAHSSFLDPGGIWCRCAFLSRYYIDAILASGRAQEERRQNGGPMTRCGRASGRQSGGAPLCRQADKISRRGRPLLRRCRHRQPHAFSTCVRAKNPGAAVDPARFRPLPLSRIGLSHRDDFSYLGCLRSSRSGGDGAWPEAKCPRLVERFCRGGSRV